MEELTKTQLILLALFVSFVTSTATGIVTVTLMEQAPPGVTQTINRVVERTIETVVRPENKETILVEKQVIVKEKDLIINAIEKNLKSTVQIKSILDNKETLVGLGVILAENGLVVTDSNIVAYDNLVAEYEGNRFAISVIPINNKVDVGFVLIKLSTTQKEVLEENETSDTLVDSNGETKPETIFTPITLGNSDNIKLGQTIIAFGWDKSNSVHIGYIEKLDWDNLIDEESGENINLLSSIHTSTNIKKENSGSLLITTAGKTVGINITTAENRFAIPINTIKKEATLFFNNTEKNNDTNNKYFMEILEPFIDKIKVLN